MLELYLRKIPKLQQKVRRLKITQDINRSIKPEQKHYRRTTNNSETQRSTESEKTVMKTTRKKRTSRNNKLQNENNLIDFTQDINTDMKPEEKYYRRTNDNFETQRSAESENPATKTARKKRTSRNNKLQNENLIDCTQDINTDMKPEEKYYRRTNDNFETQRSTESDDPVTKTVRMKRTRRKNKLQNDNLIDFTQDINTDMKPEEKHHLIINDNFETQRSTESDDSVTKTVRKKRTRRKNKLQNENSIDFTQEIYTDIMPEQKHHLITNDNFETQRSTFEEWGRKQWYDNSNFHQQEDIWQDDEHNFDMTPVTSFNSSQKLYEYTCLPETTLDGLLLFYQEKVVVDYESVKRNESISASILDQVLHRSNQNGRFCRFPQTEGSVATSLKVGKADEFDYSVDIAIINDVHLSEESFFVTYGDDDLDSFYMNEIQETEFVRGGKRFFPYERRQLFRTDTPEDIPDGYTAVRLEGSDARWYSDCCIQGQCAEWFLPYELLRSLHSSIRDVLPYISLPEKVDGVTLNTGARGPAVSMTVQQMSGPNISIDITPKLTLPTRILNLDEDFDWPRESTLCWLSEEKVASVIYKELYLVPKGDKYWKISYANCENELLRDIDRDGTWRKGCLRIVKKKLMQWKSQSQSGLKGMSTYLLKTTLLWLCEILPDDFYWMKNELANRYLNFLQELEYRLRFGKIGEYFNPAVNLLESKDRREIEELREFIIREIENIYHNY